MSHDWIDWKTKNIELGRCITCGKPARKDRLGREKVFCAAHAKKQAERERQKRGVANKYSCSMCGESGHNRQSHDLYAETS